MEPRRESWSRDNFQPGLLFVFCACLWQTHLSVSSGVNMASDNGLSPDGRFVLVPKSDYQIDKRCTHRVAEELGEVKEIVTKAGPKGKK